MKKEIEKIISELRTLLEKIDRDSDFEKGISFEDRIDIYQPIIDFFTSKFNLVYQKGREDEREKIITWANKEKKTRTEVLLSPLLRKKATKMEMREQTGFNNAMNKVIENLL